MLKISIFLKIGKAIVSNWYQNLDDKLISEYVRFKINISSTLVIAKTDKYKKEMEGVHDNASAFMHRNIKTNSLTICFCDD